IILKFKIKSSRFEHSRTVESRRKSTLAQDRESRGQWKNVYGSDVRSTRSVVISGGGYPASRILHQTFQPGRPTHVGHPCWLLKAYESINNYQLQINLT